MLLTTEQRKLIHKLEKTATAFAHEEMIAAIQGSDVETTYNYKCSERDYITTLLSMQETFPGYLTFEREQETRENLLSIMSWFEANVV